MSGPSREAEKSAWVESLRLQKVLPFAANIDPHFNIWVPIVLVQLLTMLKFVTDRIHGRLAENPSIGVV